MKSKIILFLFILLLSSKLSSSATRDLFFPENGPCSADQFRCLNDACIPRHQHCNGYRDCNDGSDEDYCNRYNSCPTIYPFYRCRDNKCIPDIWKCDGFKDCPYGDDESQCDGSKLLIRKTLGAARTNATRWLYNQLKDESSTNRWGVHLRRISVALYLGDPTFRSSSQIRKEMAYELSVQLLSKFAFRQLKNVSTYDLASYTNALIVTCQDPRKFHSTNLVEELRSRVDGQNYTNPYILLTLCNADDKMTEADMRKLNASFWNAQTEFWTETQAIAVMGLVCAGRQTGSTFGWEKLKDLTLELKKHQYRNGTVEDLKTTALVMQAIYSSESEEDSDNFDEEKALLQILRGQQQDGSFGSVMNTYYVLPVLAYKTLVNISSDNCKPYIRDRDSSLEELKNKVGPKMHVRYSLWLGNDKDLEHMLVLRVPTNISFYGIMEIAGDIDPQFRFQYVVKNGKPYVNAISGKQDDPESARFWFLYSIENSKPVPVLKSPADLFPQDNDQIIMWYRSGSWIK